MIEKEFLTVKELADYLGTSKSWVYSAVQRRLIPFMKPTKKMLFFKKQDVDEFIGRNRIPSREESMTIINTNQIIKKGRMKNEN